MIGQFSDQWKDFYKNQIEEMQLSKLYDNCNFMDIFIVGKEQLPFTLDKYNNITYMSYLEDDVPHNKKLYRADKSIFQKIWLFSNLYPDYKVLFFHSGGISVNPLYKKNKDAARKLITKVLIEYWKECIELLDHYDCVGTEYVPLGVFKNFSIQFPAPHYQGGYWWANTDYLRRLDPFYFHKPIEIQQYLGELWIGTGAPKAFSFYNSGKNHYIQEVDPPYDMIINNVRSHIKELKSPP